MGPGHPTAYNWNDSNPQECKVQSDSNMFNIYVNCLGHEHHVVHTISVSCIDFLAGVARDTLDSRFWDKRGYTPSPSDVILRTTFETMSMVSENHVPIGIELTP